MEVYICTYMPTDDFQMSICTMLYRGLHVELKTAYSCMYILRIVALETASITILNLSIMNNIEVY